MPLDLLGQLSLLWKPEFEDGDTAPLAPTHESYMETNEELDQEVNVATINRHLWLLNPETFRQWATPDPNVGFLKPSDAARFIPPILKLVQLKRTSATRITGVPNRADYRIGAEIPPVRWLTVELETNRHEMALYARIHALCTGSLGAGFFLRLNPVDISHIIGEVDEGSRGHAQLGWKYEHPMNLPCCFSTTRSQKPCCET